MWRLSDRFDPAALPLADAHYNRQTPGSPQFVPPGRCLVLLHGAPPTALWVTSWPKAEFTHHAWAGAWINSLFRRESGPLASEMIRAAVAATRARYGEPPPLGMVTFVDADEVKSRNPGCCYKMAGFRLVGRTKERGFLAFQMLPADMPPPEAAIGTQGSLFAGAR